MLVAFVLVFAGCATEPEPEVEPSPEPVVEPTPEPEPTLAPLPAKEVPAWFISCNWQSYQPTAPTGSWMERRPLNIAHQGGENEAPSSTMYALKTSLIKGADMLEIDVHVTADGELVVLHDRTVDRTTNGTGVVEEMTVEQIQALDAAYWFVLGSPADHDAPEEDYVWRGARNGSMELPAGCTPKDFRIPTLREVLTEFPDVLMNIEIKNGPPDGTGYEQALAELLAEFGRGSDTIVAAFQDQWTETFRTYNSDVDTAPGTAQAAAYKGSAMGPAPGTPSHHAVLQVPIEFNGIEVIDRDGDFVADAHANGWAVHVWTINDPETMHWLLDIGVDGIMTAAPEVLESVLQERGTVW